MRLIAFDTETFRIGSPHPDRPGVGVTPELICMTAAWTTPQGIQTALYVPWESNIAEMLQAWASDPNVHFVGHNMQYDLRVLAKHYPELIPFWFDLLVQGRIHCTQTAEKLKNVAASGQVYTATLPDGSVMQIQHALSDLEYRYLGRDRSEEKHSVHAWRLNYNQLKGLPTADWPVDATRYAIEDAEGTLRVAQAQGIEVAPPASEELRSAAAYALSIMTENGIGTDPPRYIKLNAEVEKGMQAANFGKLLEYLILTPGCPPMPYANGALAHEEDCPKKGKGKDCGCPAKIKAATKDKTATKILRSYIYEFCKLNGLQIELTDKGRTEYRHEHQAKLNSLPADNEWWLEHPGHVSSSKGFVAELASHETRASIRGPLTEYAERQNLAKLKSTYLPQLLHRDEDDPRTGQLADRVHFNFDNVKETGRTSSFAGRLYPSANGQNMDPRIRPCYKADDGNVIVSWDYSSLELVTLADTNLRLFGFSRMGELINEGVDLHAYLGAQLAYAMEPDFKEVADAHYNRGDQRGYYDFFITYKDTDAKYYKHWRKFAKPVGLGFPGGLGAATMVEFAWAAYGVKIDEDTAKLMKAIWLETFPEMQMYFDHVNKELRDPDNSYIDEDSGKRKHKYRYTTPLGMVRAGAHYTAACNGLGMQSPAAEGATLGVMLVVRACVDPTQNSILYGCKPFNFVHDEILVELAYDADPGLATRQAEEIGRLMIHAMKQIVTKVAVRGEPALMRNWYKQAEEERNEQGHLLPWDDVHDQDAA